MACRSVGNGLLHHQEGNQGMATFAEHMGMRVIRVDAEALEPLRELFKDEARKPGVELGLPYDTHCD